MVLKPGDGTQEVGALLYPSVCFRLSKIVFKNSFLHGAALLCLPSGSPMDSGLHNRHPGDLIKWMLPALLDQVPALFLTLSPTAFLRFSRCPSHAGLLFLL